MANTEQLILTDFTDGVGRVTLNRADKRNALTREMLDQLVVGITELTARDDLRVLVLQAAGHVFCAGMDLGQMQERASDPERTEQWRIDSESYHKALTALIDCDVPTIAMLPGPAVAGGVGLVLACDIVIAAKSAFCALPEPRRGITAAMVTPLLLRRTGVAQAGYVLLSGQRIESDRALSMGLCDEVVAQEDLNQTVDVTVQAILESSPQALATTKTFLHSFGHKELHEALDAAIQVSADARSTQDAREGLDAFLEKRNPGWAP